MTGAAVKPLDRADVELMERELRPMDRREFAAMSGGKSVAENLDDLLRRSECGRAFYFDGRLVAIWGVLRPTLLSTVGNPWLAATAEIHNPKAARAFIAGSRAAAAEMTPGFTRWWNCVAAENTIAIRWLKWLGFRFTGEEYVVSGMRFLRFQLEE